MVLDIELQDQTAPAEWSFNGKPIEPSDRVEIKNLGGGKHQLVFNKLEMEDDGEIKCESGKLESSMKLTVKKGESKPEIDFPSKFEAPIDRPIVMEVPYTVTGTRQTPVEGKLIKDGKALSPKEVEVVVGENKVTFKIKKPSRDQSGPYQISLSNGQGEDIKDCNITMQNVPSPPQDVDVNEVFQTNCKVSWKPSEDDGGSPISHYVVERQDISLKGILKSITCGNINFNVYIYLQPDLKMLVLCQLENQPHSKWKVSYRRNLTNSESAPLTNSVRVNQLFSASQYWLKIHGVCLYLQGVQFAMNSSAEATIRE